MGSQKSNLGQLCKVNILLSIQLLSPLTHLAPSSIDDGQVHITTHSTDAPVLASECRDTLEAGASRI